MFWSGVVSALRAAGAVAAANPLHGLAVEQGMTVRGMQTLRRGFADLTPGVVLVIDDFQVIDHPDILESIAVLLRHESPLRLVLITRTDPVLPLHRLRVSGGLHEIRSADLAFDHIEADDFFRLNGSFLPTTDVEQLIRRTEGWAAGLRLAAMYLNRESAGRVAEFAGDNQAVTEYLLAEVFASQPVQMRNFLLRTSIADRICGELADVLTDGEHSQRNLEGLERANAFITSVGARRHWFRYHPLMRETLIHQLRLEDPVLYRDLHRRAAGWFATNAAPVEAMRHAAEANDWRLMGELFVTIVGPRILSVDRQAINEALAKIPDEELGRDAAMQICVAARLEYASRFGEIPAVVVRAQRMHAQATADGGNRDLQAATGALVGLWVTAIARPAGDMEMLLQTCDDVLTRLSDLDEPFPAADQYRAVALANQGVGLIWTGHAEAAQPVLHSALESSARADLEYTSLGCLGQLALADVLLGRLDDAQQWAEKGLALADERGWASLTNAAGSYLAMALVQVLQGQPAAAEPLLRQGALASRESLPSIAIMVVQTLVDLSLHRPQSALRAIRAARERFGQLRNPPEFLLHWLAVTEAETDLWTGNAAAVAGRLAALPASPRWATREAVRSARAHLELGQLADADRVLQHRSAEPSGPLAEAEFWLATALVADRLRSDERARQSLEKAVRLAAPLRLCLPFVTFDRQRLPRMLARLAGRDQSEKEFLVELDRLAYPDGHPEAEPQPLAEQLTDREIGVLRLLPSMLSNAEIADELFISVNTVKVHLKTLYRKLDAPNRRTAVRRGKSLHLIS